MYQPIYLKIDEVLVFESGSAAVAARELGAQRLCSFSQNMKDGTKLFRHYTLSRYIK